MPRDGGATTFHQKEAALQGNVVLLHLAQQCGVVHQLAPAIGNRSGELLCLRPGIGGYVERKVHSNARGLVAQLRCRL